MQIGNSYYTFNQNDYKKRTQKASGIYFSFLIIVIIILASLLTFIKPKELNSIQFYFVEAKTFSTYQQAYNFAQEIQKTNGAGYIHYNKQYHILLNFYSNKKDAEQVVNNLKPDYPNARIYSIKAKNLKIIQNISKKQEKSAKNLSNTTISTINSLYNLCIDYDKNEISQQQVLTKTKHLKDIYQNSYNNFLNHFNKNSKYNTAKEYAFNILSNFDFIVNYNEENFSHIYKYALIDIVVNYSSFSFCFWFLDFINSTNCQIANPIKNKANNFVRISFFNLTATSAPIKLKPHPIIANNQVDLKSTNLFLMCIIIAIIAIGKNATRLTPCARNCWNDKNIVKIGIVSVPPPIPIPPIIPPKSPANISQNTISHLPKQHP